MRDDGSRFRFPSWRPVRRTLADTPMSDLPLTEDQMAYVEALDHIGDGDPEWAHDQADAILLRAVHPSIARAYQRVVARQPWWASA